MYTHEQWEANRKTIENMLPSKGRVIASDFVDFAFWFLLLPAYLLLSKLPLFSTISENGLLILIAAVLLVIEEVFLITTGGKLGMFVMRIGYVDGVTGLRFNHSKFWNYTLSSLKPNSNYSIRYDRYSYQRDPLLQRKSMQATDTYFVDLEKYKMMRENGIVPFKTNR